MVSVTHSTQRWRSTDFTEPNGAEIIAIKSMSSNYVLHVDYTISGSTITFSTWTLDEGTYSISFTYIVK